MRVLAPCVQRMRHRIKVSYYFCDLSDGNYSWHHPIGLFAPHTMASCKRIAVKFDKDFPLALGLLRFIGGKIEE